LPPFQKIGAVRVRARHGVNTIERLGVVETKTMVASLGTHRRYTRHRLIMF
jgi:hypothetical protein